MQITLIRILKNIYFVDCISAACNKARMKKLENWGIVSLQKPKPVHTASKQDYSKSRNSTTLGWYIHKWWREKQDSSAWALPLWSQNESFKTVQSQQFSYWSSFNPHLWL